MRFRTHPSKLRTLLLTIFSGLMLSLTNAAAFAESATVAVAANFTDAMKEIAALFEKETGNRIVVSFGASGLLYTQITQGAPFDAFLSADNERTRMAIQAGHAVAGTNFTYATGKIVLFSKDPALVTGEGTLRKAAFDKIAMANPTAAPYGVAAVETMKALGVYEALVPKMVQGQNITQTYQFVETGNAQLGFVALSQVIARKGGSRWLVPQKLYSPIAQDAVLLKHGENNKVARAFLAFLKGPRTRGVKEKFGYGAASQ